MTEQKQPQADEWWISKNNDIVRIVGVKMNGQVVYEMAGGGHSASSGMWPNWHHEPLCTSFDWQPPAPIDPGEGWELLPVGTVLQDGDEYLDFFGVWTETQQAGDCICDNKTMKTYRRRKPSAEMWPKYYVPTFNSEHYCRCDSENEVFAVNERTEEFQGKTATFMASSDTWREVTKSEALDRVKPAEPIAHPVERTATPLVTAVGESPDDWVEITDPEHVIRKIDQVNARGNSEKGYCCALSSIGSKVKNNEYLTVRCRRRDLPAPQPKRTPVRLWCYRYILKDGQSSTVIARHEALQNTTDFRELFYDGSGFYVEGE